MDSYETPPQESGVFPEVKPTYITVFTYRKQPIFRNSFNCELLLNIITYNKYALDYKVLGFVIMFDHLHIVFYPGQVPLYQIVHKNIAEFTRFYQKITGEGAPVWNRNYQSLPLDDYETLKKIRDFMHANPLRNRLAGTLSDYKYSSYRFYEQGRNDYALLLDKLQE